MRDILIIAAIMIPALFIISRIVYGGFISETDEQDEIEKIKSSRHRVATRNIIHFWHYEFYSKEWYGVLRRWCVNTKGFVRKGSELDQLITEEYNKLIIIPRSKQNEKLLKPC